MADNQETVMYLTRTGLLEPLGRSQVFAYLAELAKDFRIVLVTCERNSDLSDAKRMTAARADCEAANIDWRPIPFELGPRGISIARQTQRFIREVNRERFKGPLLVHARSYLPTLAALYLNRRHKIPFVFDMRALWPEELIMAGRLERGSMAHRVLQSLERAALNNGEVVSLTHAAVDYLHATYPEETEGKEVYVIPTCADLDRFVPAPLPPGPPVFGCNGTVLSGWFRLDLLAAWFRGINLQWPEAITEVVTRDDHLEVRQALSELGVNDSTLRLQSATPDEMPAIVQGQTASGMFFKGGVGKRGSCPTRMGEVLGCGRPVVSNGEIGDVASIIEQNGVGVVVTGNLEETQASVSDLSVMLGDAALAGRCRMVAENIFSLENGVGKYQKVYENAIASQQ